MPAGEKDSVESIVNRVIDPEMADSLKNIRQYSNFLGFDTTTELLEFIRGKTILDAGSGKGGLAKSIAYYHYDETYSIERVISLNPRLAIPEQRNEEKHFTAYTFRWPPVEISQAEQERMQKYHDSQAIAAFVGAIPLPPDSVDVIFDCQAIYYHRNGNPKQLEQFHQGYREFARVLRNGGKIRADKGKGEDVVDKEKVFFKQIGLRYEDKFCAFELTKV